MEHSPASQNHNPAVLESRERRGEILQSLMISARNIDGLDGGTVEEIFNSENENIRRGLLENLSDEQYFHLISGVNGILRGKEKEKWEMDGVGVIAAGHEVVGAHIFPRHEDKKEILSKTWQAAKQMNDAGRELEDIGMLLGSLLVETHPFADGNGRTSRFVYSMTKEGFSVDQNDKLSILLGEDGRWELDMALSKIYLDDLFNKRHGGLRESIGKSKAVGVFVDDESNAFGKLSFPAGVEDSTKECIIQAGRNDNSMLSFALLAFIQLHPELDSKAYIKSYGQRNNFLLQKLFSILTAQQVEEIENIYWSIKKEYVEDMIDIFVNPDKPEYKVKKNDIEIRMIDYFKKRIVDKAVLL